VPAQNQKRGEDVLDTTLYVTYYVTQQQRVGFRRMEGGNANGRPLFPLTERGSIEESFKHVVEEFLVSRSPKGQVIEAFTETPESRRTSKWPQLLKAIQACKQTGATLLIAELGTLTNNESFTQLLLESGVKFHCCDQPFVNQSILEALSKHAQVQKKLHGKLIREGLKMTSAKSGNPNAAKVISEVNKPKIHTAIVFAFILQLIIKDYVRKGYSQRQMVKTLNEEGFTAPEGGKWVLSQLQKVLDRVKLNEVATDLKATIDEFTAGGLSAEQMAENLNSKSIPPLKRSAWDELQVKKLLDRLQQIQDIVLLNQFVLSLLPLLHAFQKLELPVDEMLGQFHAAGINIRHNYPVGPASIPAPTVYPDLHRLLQQLNQDLNAFPEGTGYLDLGLESSVKHIPAYLKIVKGHIDQLGTVLELEAHNHQNLANAELALPVIQLIKLFQELKEQDSQLLETLAMAAINWQGEEVTADSETPLVATV